MTTLVKEITVSHWGNIYVDEHYELRHAGAKHSGSFSRLKYSYQYGVGASFKDVRAKLPATTHSIYYTCVPACLLVSGHGWRLQCTCIMYRGHE